MAHFLPLTFGLDKNPQARSLEIARLLRDRIIVLHGVPSSIVTDRNPRFTSNLAQNLYKILGITQDISTAAYPETNGQSERTIQTLEQYFRAYIFYQQTNWPKWLALAEFSYNNTVSSTTNVTPFFANYGYHPNLDLDTIPGTAPNTPDFQADATKLQRLNNYLRSEILLTRDSYKEYADRRRQPSPMYAPGNYIWLSSRHIKTTRPCRKLDHKRLGRFKVLRRVGSHAYLLELPATMKIHPVFHVSLLEPCNSDPLPGQVQAENPPPIVVDKNNEWEVEEILDSRMHYQTPQYLVRWTGYDHPTWEPAEYLSHTPAVVADFHQQYPNKFKP